MRPRALVTISMGLALSLLAADAWSNSGGRSGFSGKTGTNCNSCHSGGTTPAVSLAGPDRLDAGTSATYTFTIVTGAAITGMNAAATDGVTLEGDAGGATLTDFNEVVHARTVIPEDGGAVYEFTLVAPPYGGTIKLYAAGNACDDDGQTDGDRAADTSLEITVDGPPKPPPDASAPPPPPPKTPPPPPPENDGGADGGEGAAPTPGEDEASGCAVAWTDRGAVPGAFATIAGAALALTASRRRNRRR